MAEQKISLEGVFKILSKANILFTDKNITLNSEDVAGAQASTTMTLSNFIAMNFAWHLVEDGGDKAEVIAEVIAAMSAAGYDEEAYPKYDYYGITYGGGRNGKRKSTRRNKK